ncbi:MAG: hypothetical protein EOP00_17785, partial [Pedobacter sp.]
MLRIETSSILMLDKLKATIMQEGVLGVQTASWRKSKNSNSNASDLLQNLRLSQTHIKSKVSRDNVIITNDLYTIPENWCWCKFEDVAIIETNLVSPNKYLEYPHVAPDSIEKNTGVLLNYRT